MDPTNPIPFPRNRIDAGRSHRNQPAAPDQGHLVTADDTFAALAAERYSDVAAHPAEIASALHTYITESASSSGAAASPVCVELGELAGMRIELPTPAELPRLIEVYKRTGRMTGISAGHSIAAACPRASGPKGLGAAAAPCRPNNRSQAAAGIIAGRIASGKTSGALADNLPVKMIGDLLSLPRKAAVAALTEQLEARGRPEANSLADEVVDALGPALFRRTVLAAVRQELVDVLAAGATTLITIAEIDSRRGDLVQMLLAQPVPVATLALEQLGFDDIAETFAAGEFASAATMSAALQDAAAVGSVQVRTLRAQIANQWQPIGGHLEIFAIAPALTDRVITGVLRDLELDRAADSAANAAIEDGIGHWNRTEEHFVMVGLTVAAAIVAGSFGGPPGMVAGVAMGVAEASPTTADARVAKILAKAGAISQEERDQRVLSARVNLGVGLAFSLVGGAIPVPPGAGGATVSGIFDVGGLLGAGAAVWVAEQNFAGSAGTPHSTDHDQALAMLALWRLAGQEQTLRRQWQRVVGVGVGGDDESGEARFAEIVLAYARESHKDLARLIADQQIASDFRSFARALLPAGIPAQPR